MADWKVCPTKMSDQTATAEPPVETIVRPKKSPQDAKQKRKVPRYNVVLWDSDQHTYEYVELMLRDLFGHPPAQCHQLATTVDKQGKAVVLTTTLEHAELKRDQIIAFGADERMADCKGAMHATVEKAD